MNPIQKAFLAPTSGQLEAIEKTLLSKDKYIIWQGVAGAGKTYAVRQIVDEAKQNGFEVKGFAPSAAAAQLLSKETGIETETLQGHILKRENLNNSKSLCKTLWIVDEAGMISAKDFQALQTKAEKHNARVLLVGDHRQLSPVDAGNPFLDVQRHTSTTLIHLNKSLRQKDALLQVAVAHINRGDVAEGVRNLGASVYEVKTGRGRKNLVSREFTKKDPAAQENTLVLARTNRIREDLTTEIREQLKKQGFLRNEIVVPVLRKIDATDEQLSVSSTYSQADFLVPNKNYQGLGLAKDQPYEVVSSNGSRNSVLVRSGSKTIEIPLSKHHQFSLFSKGTLPLAEGDKMIWNRNVKGQGQLNNGGFVVEQVTTKGVRVRTDEGHTKVIDPKVPQHMEHAWALTIYKAQGQTASNVLQIVDPGSTKRDLLVGVTRAAHEVILVAESKQAVFKSAEFDPQKPIAAEEVLATNLSLNKNSAKISQGQMR
jgi:ATP-dependent exoDNAse (exonuclease V) alpha subunit